MKKLAILNIIGILFSIFTFSLPGFCQTVVPFNILQSTHWTKAGSPYLVKSTVNIASDVVVTIEAGARVEFYENGAIQLSGALIAMGNREDSVTFISAWKQGTSTDFTSITLNKGCFLSLQYCSVKNHFYFVDDNNSKSTIQVNHSYFLNNVYSFSGAEGSLIVVKNTKFISNFRCILKTFVSADSCSFISNKTCLLGITGIISHSRFERNEIAAIKEPSTIYLDSNTFLSNYIGLQIKSESQNITIKENDFSKNIIGIQISGNSLAPYFTATKNLFCNEQYNIDNQSTFNFDFSNNCWCTADTTYINLKLHSSPKINFQPLHPSCRGCKPELHVIRDTVCTGSPFEIELVNKGESPNEKYLWTSAATILQKYSADALGFYENDTLSKLIRIDFQLILQDSSCRDSAMAAVYFYPKNDKHCRNCFAVNAGKDTTICSGDEVMLGTSSNNLFYQFNWTPAEGLRNMLSERPLFSLENKSLDVSTRSIPLVLTVVDSAAQCYNTDSLVVTILSEYSEFCKGLPKIHVYNVITPNGDGQNQNFTIDNIDFYPQNEVSVYNNWGNRVMHTKNYRNNWDGNNLADGVYYYIVTIPELSQEFKGDLTIKK